MTDRLRNNRVLRHGGVWLASWALFYFMVRIGEGHAVALRLTSAIMLAGPLPVYTHFAALGRLFERRRYAIYALVLLAIVAASTVGAELIYRLIERDPASHSNGLGVTILFLTFSTGFRYFSRGMSHQYRLQEAEYKQLQTEMALLRSQVNPHFLFNSLNTLYALSLGDPERTPDAILKLSELLRYLVDCSHRRSVSLEEEIRFIESYVALERLRLDGRPEIKLNVPTPPEEQRIAPMLLIPFVENAFKHGLPAGGAGGHLRVDVGLTGDRLSFSVGNGKPRTPRSGGNGSGGLGVENAKRRLELLYPKRHRLRTDDQEDTHRVDLDLWL